MIPIAFSTTSLPSLFSIVAPISYNLLIAIIAICLLGAVKYDSSSSTGISSLLATSRFSFFISRGHRGSLPTPSAPRHGSSDRRNQTGELYFANVDPKSFGKPEALVKLGETFKMLLWVGLPSILSSRFFASSLT